MYSLWNTARDPEGQSNCLCACVSRTGVERGCEEGREICGGDRSSGGESPPLIAGPPKAFAPAGLNSTHTFAGAHRSKKGAVPVATLRMNRVQIRIQNAERSSSSGAERCSCLIHHRWRFWEMYTYCTWIVCVCKYVRSLTEHEDCFETFNYRPTYEI